MAAEKEAWPDLEKNSRKGDEGAGVDKQSIEKTYHGYDIWLRHRHVV